MLQFIISGTLVLFNSWTLDFRKNSTRHDNFEKQTLILDIQKSTGHGEFKKDYHTGSTYITHNLINYSTLSSLGTRVAAAKHIYLRFANVTAVSSRTATMIKRYSIRMQNK